MLAVLFTALLAGPGPASAVGTPVGNPVLEPVEQCLAPVEGLFTAAEPTKNTCVSVTVSEGELKSVPDTEKVEATKEKVKYTKNGKEVVADALVITFKDRKNLDGCRNFVVRGKDTGEVEVIDIPPNAVALIPPNVKDVTLVVICDKK
jgi:hypothetical protein